MAANRSKLRDAIIKKATKAGAGGMLPVSNMEFISTGSLVLDRGFGGGYPKRRMTQIWGEPNTGKSTLAMFAAREVILNGGYVLWIDSENSFVRDWAEKLNIPIDAVDENGDPRFEVWFSKTAEGAMQAMLDFMAEDIYDLVVVDSIASLSPSKEQEIELTKATMATQAGLMTRVQRLITPHMVNSKRGVAVLYINQARANFNVQSHAPTKAAGGMAVHHSSGLTIGLLTPHDGYTGDSIDRLVIRAKIRKTKVSEVNKTVWEAHLARTLTGGFDIDVFYETLLVGKLAGAFRTSSGDVFTGGAGNVFFPRVNPDTGEITQVLLGNGQAKVTATLAADPDLFGEVYAKVYEMRTNRSDAAIEETENDPEDVAES